MMTKPFTYSAIRLNSSDVHLLEFDNSQCELVLVPSESTSGKSVLSKIKNDWMTSNGYVEVGKVNASYFYKEGSKYRPLGFQVLNWESTPRYEGKRDSWLEVMWDGSNIKVDDIYGYEYTEYYGGKYSWCYTSGKVLAINSEKVMKLSDDVIRKGEDKLNPNTVFATNGTKSVLMVVDGRGMKSTINKQKSLGMSLNDIADYLLAQGYTDIVANDSGGSSEMIYKGRVVNNPSDGNEREVVNALVLYVKKELLINNDNSSQPNDQSDNSVTDKLDPLLIMMNPFKISAGEEFMSHKGSHAVDFNGVDTGKDYMRATVPVRVSKITSIGRSNIVYFTTVNPVLTPKFGPQVVTFQCIHINNDDFKSIGYYEGKVFNKGDIIYREGTAGLASGNHIHFESGLGTVVGTGMEPTGTTFTMNGTTYKNYRLTTSGGSQHIYDLFYITNDIKQLRGLSEQANNYPWVTYDDKQVTEINSVDLPTGTKLLIRLNKVRIRKYPMMSSEVIGTLDINSTLDVTKITESKIDNYYWVQVTVNNVTGWSAIIDEVSILEYPKIDEPKPDQPQVDLSKYEELIKEKDLRINNLVDEVNKLKIDLEYTLDKLTEVTTKFNKVKSDIKEVVDKW